MSNYDLGQPSNPRKRNAAEVADLQQLTCKRAKLKQENKYMQCHKQGLNRSAERRHGLEEHRLKKAATTFGARDMWSDLFVTTAAEDGGAEPLAVESSCSDSDDYDEEIDSTEPCQGLDKRSCIAPNTPKRKAGGYPVDPAECEPFPLEDHATSITSYGTESPLVETGHETRAQLSLKDIPNYTKLDDTKRHESTASLASSPSSVLPTDSRNDVGNLSSENTKDGNASIGMIKRRDSSTSCISSFELGTSSIVVGSVDDLIYENGKQYLLKLIPDLDWPRDCVEDLDTIKESGLEWQYDYMNPLEWVQ